VKPLITFILVWATISAAIISCKKTQGMVTTPPPVDSIKTFFLDSNIYILKDTNLTTGVFHYSVSGQSLPHFNKGDFFIEPRNFGYLRKIDDFKITGTDLYLYSEQATILDAFKMYGDFNGTFSLPAAMNPFSYAMKQARHAMVGPYSLTKTNGNSTALGSFPDFTISVPGLDYTFSSMGIDFNPVFRASFSAQHKSFSLGIDSTSLSTGYYVSVQKSSEAAISRTDTFHLRNYFPPDISKLFSRIPLEVMGPNGLPIIGDIDVDLLIVLKYNGTQAVSDRFAVSQQHGFAMNMNYQNASLDSKFKYNVIYNDDFYNTQMTDNNALATAVSIIPVYKINFYNVPVTSISLLNKAAVAVENSTNPISWDEMAQYSLQGTIDFDNRVFGYSPNSKSSLSSTEMTDTVYRAPGQIKSTGSVSGKPGDNVPVSIEILDSRFAPLLFPTTVYYTSDIGAWDNASLLSSPATGTATNNFTIAAGTNNIQIAAKDPHNNTLISFSQSVISDTIGNNGFNLLAIGPNPIPGMVPWFNDSPGSVYVAGGNMYFTQGAASFNVEIFGANNTVLYSGSATVMYYGHDSGGQPTFQATDSTYPGAQNYPGHGWGCMMPPGFEMFFNIGGNSYVGMVSSGSYVLMLPAGYCVF